MYGWGLSHLWDDLCLTLFCSILSKIVLYSLFALHTHKKIKKSQLHLENIYTLSVFLPPASSMLMFLVVSVCLSVDMIAFEHPDVYTTYFACW